jgi:hypothetical protein
MQLKCCLTGVAAQMLWDGEIDSDVSNRKLVSILRAFLGRVKFTNGSPSNLGAVVVGTENLSQIFMQIFDV